LLDSKNDARYNASINYFSRGDDLRPLAFHPPQKSWRRD
jgi:hypothetical protein